MKKVVHFEIPVDNLARAKKFYSIFGWQMQDWPMPDDSVYVGATTVETDDYTAQPKEPGAINGGIVLRDQYTKSPTITINVDSVDEYIAKVKKAGGDVVKPKQAIEGMGYFAYVSDTENNTLGLWEDAKPQ
jgi:uncharacterized protein